MDSPRPIPLVSSRRSPPWDGKSTPSPATPGIPLLLSRPSLSSRANQPTRESISPGSLAASPVADIGLYPEELEMDSYHDDEESGIVAPDTRRTGHAGRGLRHRAADGSEESLVSEGVDDDEVTAEEKKEADVKVIRDLAINAMLIGLWYLFSLLISVYNKWMFSPDHLNFHFPLFITCVHMVVQFSLASLVLFALPQFRPVGFFGTKALTEDSLPAIGESTGRRWFRFNSRGEERRKKQQGIMTKWVYLTKIGPCGAATGLDIGLGNMSLKFISLSFYTMCKSSSLAFVLLFAFAFRLEKVTWKLVGIIAIMTAGVVMMVAGEAQFILIGFVLVLTASALSGVRWSLTQILLLRNPATSNPFSSIFFLAPCMFVSILAIAIPVEGFGPLFERFGELAEREGFLAAVGIVLFPGIIAFLMVSSEFALLKRSSVVTLSICGIFKEVMTISAAAIIFKDPLTPVNISGLLVTIISIAAYNYIKISKMREEAVQETHFAHHHASGTTRADTGYAAVAGDFEDLENESVHTGNRDGVSNTNFTGLENDIGGNHDNDIRVGESAISPLI